MRLWSKQHVQPVTEHVTRDLDESKPALVKEFHYQKGTKFDGLTGILDRAEFERHLNEELENVRRSGETFVLVFFDLDEFKRLNEEHGYQKGKRVLNLVARTLQSSARNTDFVAHYGVDEYAILMRGASLVQARRFFEKVRSEIAEHSRCLLGFKVTLSAGAVKFLDGAGDVQSFMEAADNAMYIAKRQGKDRMFTAVAIGLSDERRKLGVEI